MTGDPARDDHATEHHLESLPADEYAAARAERERQQRERMDAAHEAARAEAERCDYVGGCNDNRCLLAVGHDGGHLMRHDKEDT